VRGLRPSRSLFTDHSQRTLTSPPPLSGQEPGSLLLEQQRWRIDRLFVPLRFQRVRWYVLTNLARIQVTMCCRQLARYPAALRTAVDRVSKAPTGPKPHTDIPNTPGGPNRSVVVHRDCSCETKKTTSSRRIGPVATRYSSSTFHEPSCPWSWANGSESDYAVSLSMRPFLNKIVNYLFSASHWGGGSTFTRTLSTYRTVSRQLSLA